MLRLLSRSSRVSLLVAGLLSVAPLRAAPPVVHPPAMHQVSAPGRAQEIQVELAWMEDPVTFRLPLRAHTKGSVLEVSGSVPSAELKARALKIAREKSGAPVRDAMTISRTAREPFKAVPADKLGHETVHALGEVLGKKAQDIEVNTTSGGRVTLRGPVATVEEKFKVSTRMRQVHGCSCVMNFLEVKSSASRAQPESIPSKIQQVQSVSVPSKIQQAQPVSVPSKIQQVQAVSKPEPTPIRSTVAVSPYQTAASPYQGVTSPYQMIAPPAPPKNARTSPYGIQPVSVANSVEETPKAPVSPYQAGSSLPTPRPFQAPAKATAMPAGLPKAEPLLPTTEDPPTVSSRAKPLATPKAEALPSTRSKPSALPKAEPSLPLARAPRTIPAQTMSTASPKAEPLLPEDEESLPAPKSVLISHSSQNIQPVTGTSPSVAPVPPPPASLPAPSPPAPRSSRSGLFNLLTRKEAKPVQPMKVAAGPRVPDRPYVTTGTVVFHDDEPAPEPTVESPMELLRKKLVAAGGPALRGVELKKTSDQGLQVKVRVADASAIDAVSARLHRLAEMQAPDVKLTFELVP